ncbi:MAG: CRISPR-associated DxTHG motif protein [Saprospiraceae bacterium]|nr:CRISPR-associated DxTHG motif protein [Saprospiraceae bacterium]
MNCERLNSRKGSSRDLASCFTANDFPDPGIPKTPRDKGFPGFFYQIIANQIFDITHGFNFAPIISSQTIDFKKWRICQLLISIQRESEGSIKQGLRFDIHRWIIISLENSPVL